MRFAKQVLFTIFVAIFLTACEDGNKIPQTPEQTIIDNNQQDQQKLQFIREHTSYLYDSETKMCLMRFFYQYRLMTYSAYGSVATVPCLNVVEKLSPEHQKQYFADAGKHLDKVQ